MRDKSKGVDGKKRRKKKPPELKEPKKVGSQHSPSRTTDRLPGARSLRIIKWTLELTRGRGHQRNRAATSFGGARRGGTWVKCGSRPG